MRSSVDAEPALAPRCPLDDLDSFDASLPRAAAAPGHHGLDVFRRPLEKHSDGAVGLVSRPAADTETVGLLLAGGAEEDTLNEPMDDGLTSDHAGCGHTIIMPCRDDARRQHLKRSRQITVPMLAPTLTLASRSTAIGARAP